LTKGEYRERKAAGLCVLCRAETDGKGTLCAVCRKKRHTWIQERNKARALDMLCTNCGRPLEDTGYLLCEACRENGRTRMRRRGDTA